MEARNQFVNGLRIAQALTSDYISIYYVDTATDRFIEYSSSDEYQELGIETEGEDFFAISARNAKRLIHPDDLEGFTKAMQKENLVEITLRQRKTFRMSYRMLFDGQPIYVQMKATGMGDGDSRHIVIGVVNVDAQRRAQEAIKKLEEERLAYSRLFALAGDYLCIYTVDPDTEDYIAYSTTTDYDRFGLAKSGSDFFDGARRDSPRAVHPSDVGMFNELFTRENVLGAIREGGVFALNYRMIIDGHTKYVFLKAVTVQEEGRDVLLIGITDVTDQVERDEAHAREVHRARRLASVDALTGVKNKSAYVDLEKRLNERIRRGEQVRFAVVVFDLNDLKRVNDTYGHQEGDKYLKSACATICHVFKHSPVFRVGGDEFVAISQDSDYDRIEELMGEMKRNNETVGSAVIACGMARYDGDANVAAVFNRADERMYENKKDLKEN